MAEYFDGAIRIGGNITREQWDRMKEIEPELARSIPSQIDGIFEHCSANTRMGQFEELETYLQEQGISYDRHSGAAYDFDAEETSFRPGVPVITAYATNGGTILCDAYEVLDYIIRHVDIGDIPKPDEGGDSGLALVLLRKYNPLPKFYVS